MDLDYYQSVLNCQTKESAYFPAPGDHILPYHDGSYHWFVLTLRSFQKNALNFFTNRKVGLCVTSSSKADRWFQLWFFVATLLKTLLHGSSHIKLLHNFRAHFHWNIYEEFLLNKCYWA